jgi:hypothetical protein
LVPFGLEQKKREAVSRIYVAARRCSLQEAQREDSVWSRGNYLKFAQMHARQIVHRCGIASFHALKEDCFGLGSTLLINVHRAEPTKGVYGTFGFSRRIPGDSLRLTYTITMAVRVTKGQHA